MKLCFHFALLRVRQVIMITALSALCAFPVVTLRTLADITLGLEASAKSEGGLDAKAVATNNRGVALMGQFDYEAARTEFNKLAEKYPDNDDIQVNLAIATLNRQTKGDEQLALGILERVLKRSPKQLRARYCSGLLELHMGRPAAALEDFQKVFAADPEDMEASYFIGQCLMQLARYEEALEWFRRCMAGDPHLRSAHYSAFMALQRLGRKEEAIGVLENFTRLKDDPRSRLIEFKYTNMGHKAEALAIGVEAAGAAEKPAGPLFGKAKHLISDTQPDLWTDSTNTVKGRFNVTAADINGDGLTDIFISGAVAMGEAAGNALLIGTPDATGYVIDGEHPLAKIQGVNTSLWGDFDNDGLTDVYLCRRGPNQLWKQVAKGTWQDVTQETGTAGSSLDTLDGVLFDADHDGDLDLFVVNADGPNELFNNNRDGTFRPLAADHGLTGNGAPSKSVIVADVDNDRDADLIVINQRPPHEVYLNELFWNYTPAMGWETFVASEVCAAVAGDVDSDGRREVYTANAAGVLTRWQRTHSGKWEGTALNEVSSPGSPALSGSMRLALADVDGDGVQEVVSSGREGWLVVSILDTGLVPLFQARDGEVAKPAAWSLLASDRGPLFLGWLPGRPPFVWPAGCGRYGFMTLMLMGMQDKSASMRSNASGIGARVAARVGSRWTVLDTHRNDSGPGQGLQPLNVGLAGAERADFVAIDWPDGVYQTELDLRAGAINRITETQRQLSSCPVLFAWDGKGFQFVSDLLGVGGLGYALGPGEYAAPRPWENFMVPAGLLQTRENRFLIKLAEPMEEATYLDALRLVCYDLPPGWSMTLDERMGLSGPEPTGRPIYFRKAVLPVQAVNDRGQDVTSAITARDLRAAPPGDLDRRFIGRLQQDHIITLTFSGAITDHPGQPLLQADGWVEYPYSQTNFAAWQAGADYRAPTIEALGEDGLWHTVLTQFGYPAGMPRQMSVALQHLPEGTRKLRLSTNQEIYWDRLAVAYAEPCPAARRQGLPMVAAHLEQSGFPQRTNGSQRQPSYNYSRRRPFWDTRFLEGHYTRLGPVNELLQARDNALAIFGPGEEIHLEFENIVPPLAPGWTRTHVIEAFGWCKDMDLYTQHGETIEPIPHLGKRDPRAIQLHEAYNTRYLSGH